MHKHFKQKNDFDWYWESLGLPQYPYSQAIQNIWANKKPCSVQYF